MAFLEVIFILRGVKFQLKKDRELEKELNEKFKRMSEKERSDFLFNIIQERLNEVK